MYGTWASRCTTRTVLDYLLRTTKNAHCPSAPPRSGGPTQYSQYSPASTTDHTPSSGPAQYPPVCAAAARSPGAKLFPAGGVGRPVRL